MLRRRFCQPSAAPSDYRYLPAAYLTTPNGVHFNGSCASGAYHRVKLTFSVSELPAEDVILPLAANTFSGYGWTLGIKNGHIVFREVNTNKSAEVHWEEFAIKTDTWYTVDYYGAVAALRRCSLNGGAPVEKTLTTYARLASTATRDVVIGSAGGEVSLRGEILFCGTTSNKPTILNTASFNIEEAEIGAPFAMTCGSYLLSGDAVVCYHEGESV